MRQARPLGLTADGASILLVTEDGEQISVTADASLRAAFSMQRSRREGSDSDMSSQLTPREIQTRIRAGESLEQVANAAGVPPERVEPFAGPVLAERAHIAGTALTSPVRRAGETGNHRALRSVIAEVLRRHLIDEATVEWDSWRTMDRIWMVVGTFDHASELRRAEFRFDQRGRYSVAVNDDAKWLTDEAAPEPVATSTARTHAVDPDNEPTVDFNDEFALVHAVGAETRRAREVIPPDHHSVPDEFALDAAMEGELFQEADGVYDIVPDTTGPIDTLYEIFSDAPEPPVIDAAPRDDDLPPAFAGTPTREAEPPRAARRRPAVEQAPQERPATPTRRRPKATAPAEPSADEQAAEESTRIVARRKPAAPKPAPAPAPAPVEALPEATPEDGEPKTKRKKRRASVPSWDEIMFGGPNE